MLVLFARQQATLWVLRLAFPRAFKAGLGLLNRTDWPVWLQGLGMKLCTCAGRQGHISIWTSLDTSARGMCTLCGRCDAAAAVAIFSRHAIPTSRTGHAPCISGTCTEELSCSPSRALFGTWRICCHLGVSLKGCQCVGERDCVDHRSLVLEGECSFARVVKWSVDLYAPVCVPLMYYQWLLSD